MLRVFYDMQCPQCGNTQGSNSSNVFCSNCGEMMYYNHITHFRENGTKDNESWHDQNGNWLNGYDYDENGNKK
jgi:hypothetical protein